MYRSTHLFDEAGALDPVTALAADWPRCLVDRCHRPELLTECFSGLSLATRRLQEYEAYA